MPCRHIRSRDLYLCQLRIGVTLLPSTLFSSSLQAALPITVPLPLTAISLFGSTKDGIMHVYGDSKRFAQLITYLHQKTEETVESSSTRTGRRMLGIFILIMNSLLVKCFDVRTSEGQHSCISFLTEDTNV